MTDCSPTTDAAMTAPAKGSARFYRAEWFNCLLLALVGFAVRVPALQGEPIWDDDYLVRTNPLIKSPLLILETFRHYLFQDTFSAHYRPVQNLSYLFDYLFWNNNFYGFHLTSLFCHVGSGVLLYFLLRRILPALQPQPPIGSSLTGGSGTRLPAYFVALLWIVHPVHSAAVDYVSGRADSLAFLFACSGWLLFLKARSIANGRAQWILFGAGAMAGLLALCSRESGLTWVVLFCVYTVAFDKSLTAGFKWKTLFGCAAILGAYGLLRTLPGPANLPNDPSDATPPLLRVVLMFRSLADYARLMIFPSNLHMERTVYSFKAYQGEPGRWNAIEYEYLTVGGVIVLIALAVLAIRKGRGQRLRLLGVAWFFVAYLPVSNLLNLNATVAEHWLYLPSVGGLIFALGCVLDLPPSFQRAATAFGCVAVIALGTRSVYRSSDWTSNETFARRTLASGGTTTRVVLLLGQAIASRGDYAAAERLLRRAVQLSPDYPMARNNLADALVHQGKEKEAEAMFAQSTKTAVQEKKDYPRTWIAALNLSQLRHKEHDDSGAIAVLEQARRDYPNTWELISAETELLRENDKTDAALPLIQDFAKQNWWHYRAWGGYGRLLAQRGDPDAATAALQHASWLDIHETTALNLIAMIRIRENKLDEAWRTQRRAVARQPDEPRQYLLLANILDKMGRNDEARAALAHVSRLREVAGSKTAQN